MPRKPPAHESLIAIFSENRWLAHQQLFAHRHTDEPCKAHAELIEAIYKAHPRQVIEGFRGLGKSTYLEEAAVLRACLHEFRYMVIVSASEKLAKARLASIKNEFVINDQLISTFGMLKAASKTWQETRIVLANGCCLEAIGRDQSITGLKYLDHRPDAALVDDVEDPQEIRTDAERESTWRWFTRTFLLALDNPHLSWVRVLGTRRGVGSLPERCEKARWPTLKLPIEYLDDNGDRNATWPAKFSLRAIDALKRDEYAGDLQGWNEEMMCEPAAEGARIFSRSLLRCEPKVRSWQAVYAMYDPARTVGRKAATTGKAVWSYIGNRIVFWHASAHEWMPDQIIDDLFATHAEYELTWEGFEEDGLNEWARQPIRAEMLKRRVMLPLLPVRAPKGKLDFIRGLQHWMTAGEITFAGSEPEFKDVFDQFLSFPSGRIDAPNACAYALLLRPGAPIYEAFDEAHVSPTLAPDIGRPAFLAANSDGALVVAALVQRTDGELRILADWVREGSPQEVIADIHTEACLAAGTTVLRTVTEYGEGSDIYKVPVTRQIVNRRPVTWVVPAWHKETYRNVGLVQSIRAVPTTPAIGGDLERGRAAVSEMLARRGANGRPRLLVSPYARWTLRGFAGGYARPVGDRGMAGREADAGIYRLLFEGLEAFAAIGAGAEENDEQQPLSYTRSGVAYRSALATRG